ncbi:trypsin-like peptidase domain-containing protein [Marinicella litoralis]|uniref:Trypsin-like peptidase n=1 Tax=Marinicella litoralis TaxID=644220 RepID=A0A4R6XTI9_9GAMM|nr:trypsin-like peptidase domain-containing protein [Marinicella litoralis]TDR23272.1 trypsin-like peptidase [Marinicella litoralis]
MKNIIFLLLLSGLAHSQNKETTYYLPAIDVAAEKSQLPKSKGPLKYAINTIVNDIKINDGKSTTGQWRADKTGYSIWTINIQADNATSLDFGFKEFYLPPSATLTVYNNDETVIKGPYTGAVNKKNGYFWPGTVPGDSARIEIVVADKFKNYLTFNLANIYRGFYKFWEQPLASKSLSCNIDVNCPEGDDWENQINSVARYSFATNNGASLCTGQLINNTAQNGTPYFLTANHCGFEGATTQNQKEAIAASMNIWWNYQSLSCRTPGSAQSGTQISTAGFNDTQSGASYIANNSDSDFALVSLNQVPNSNYGVEYTGWDRSDIAPDSAVSIHHPRGHAKRIAIENNPLSITSPFASQGVNNTHLSINVWDEGLTEQGSSGGGLWNSGGLLVGQLHFGDLAQVCTDPVSDSYGRFNTSWDQGANTQSRLKEWLDPLNTGQMTLQGTGGCDAPAVSIINNSSNAVGDNLIFESQVSGGIGPYTYEWDINGDELIDGQSNTVQVRYPKQYVGNVNLSVKDSTGCESNASQAVVIEGPYLELQQLDNIRINLDLVCGNNDEVIDPGERWTSTIEVSNVGSSTATDAFVAMGVAQTSVLNGVADNYGNVVSSCDRLFIDISSTGDLIPWEAAANVTGTDAADEGSALIQLSQAFEHYGQAVNQLRASTNGFLSTSANATGGDWDNDCPLPQAPDKDNEGARIAPMHDDLRDALFYHQSFSSCPRASEMGGDLACEVFLWKGADLYDTQGVIESIDIQAILYPTTSQWVYQYSGTGFDGSSSTTGMQNPSATDGLTFACNTASSINNTDAVCTFNKNHLPESDGADFVKLEIPAIPVGNLAANQSGGNILEFSVAENATCGTSFAFNHEASVYDQGFNAGKDNIFVGTIGNNGVCNPVTHCDVADNGNDIDPRDGLWWNPNRSGNGVDLHVTNQSSLLYVMYTGNPDRSPIWYIANNAESAHNQYYNDILKVEYPGGFAANNQQIETVGWSNTTFTSDTSAIQVRRINGELSAEKIILDQFAADPTPNMHTGHYYSPSENGWGQSIITLGDVRVAIGYIYDQLGAPFWTIASGSNDGGEKTVVTADTFCPHCPSLPLDVHTIGTLRMDLNGQSNGTINEYIISYPPEAAQPQATWNKSNLSIENLVPADN